MHHLWDQIVIAPEASKCKGLVEAFMEFNSVQQFHKIKLVAESVGKLSNHALKLNLFSNIPTQGPPRLRWFLITLSELREKQPSTFSDYCSVFVLMENEGNQDFELWPEKSIKVNKVQQIIHIISMEEKQFKRRIKMELLIRKSQQKYTKKTKVLKIYELSSDLIKFTQTKAITSLTKAMKFYGTKRRSCLKRFFCQWTIFHFEKELQNQEQEIIREGYFQKNENIKILKKFFGGWKKISFLLND